MLTSKITIFSNDNSTKELKLWYLHYKQNVKVGAEEMGILHVVLDVETFSESSSQSSNTE